MEGAVGRDVEGLREPLGPGVHRLLRGAVLDHISTERRRSHPAVLHVGVPGATTTSLRLDPGDATDHGLRTDVVAAMRQRTMRPGGVPLVWVTRTGTLELQDVDARWLSAALAAYAEAGDPLLWVVVNRRGWRDPRSGLSRTWVRLRPRPQVP